MKKAFTILEILVVTAIIALLASLLFPVFSRAKHAARKATCISNLRHLGLAVQLYQGDANGLLPVGEVLHWQNTMGDGSKTKVQSTRDMIKPLLSYAGVGAALKCPENDAYFLPRWVESFSPVLNESRLMIPTPGTVLAQCEHHLDVGWSGRPGSETITTFPASDRRGFHLVLHADGSVGRVDAQAVIQLTYHRVDGKDVWVAAKGSRPHVYDTFPEENWPPAWIKLPENVTINWGHSF